MLKDLVTNIHAQANCIQCVDALAQQILFEN